MLNNILATMNSVAGIISSVRETELPDTLKKNTLSNLAFIFDELASTYKAEAVKFVVVGTVDYYLDRCKSFFTEDRDVRYNFNAARKIDTIKALLTAYENRYCGDNLGLKEAKEIVEKMGDENGVRWR